MDMFGITGLIPLSGPSDSDYGGGNGKRGRGKMAERSRANVSVCGVLYSALFFTEPSCRIHVRDHIRALQDCRALLRITYSMKLSCRHFHHYDLHCSLYYVDAQVHTPDVTGLHVQVADH